MAVIKSVNNISNRYIAQSLIGREIEITDRELISLNSGSFITIDNQKIFKDNIDFGEMVVDNTTEVVKHLSNKYHRVEDPATALSYGLSLKKNVLFYGKGGFGKSEITIDFFKYAYEQGIIDEEPFVMSLGEGTTDDDLFGGMDLKHFQATGEVRYMLENSFMNHKYVIFEEMFDAHPNALLSLKDILTSKRFRKGTQNEPIRTEMIVGLTNKSKSDFSTDDSKKAFADRFTYVYRLEWDNTGIDDYTELFKKRFGQSVDKNTEYGKIANIIHNYNNSGGSDYISPRTAITIMEAHLAGQVLKFIPGINAELITKYEKQISNNRNLVDEARGMVESFHKVASANNIIRSGMIAPATSNSLAIGATVLAKLKGEPEVVVPLIPEREELLSNEETKEYIKSVTDRLEAIIDNLSDEKEKETVTLMLSDVQLHTINS